MRKRILIIAFPLFPLALAAQWQPAQLELLSAHNSLKTRPDTAAAVASRMLALAKDAGNDTLEGQALMVRGEAYFHLGRFSEALREFQRCSRIAEHLEDDLQAAEAWRWIGDLCTARDSLAAAVQAYEESFAHWQSLGDEGNKARVLILKGEALAAQDNQASARQAYLASLKIGRRSFLDYESAIACQHLGDLYAGTQDFALARHHLRQALRHYRRRTDDVQRAACYKSLAAVSLTEKKYDLALPDAERGMLLARETGQQALLGELYLLLGEIMSGKGDFEKASDYYKLKALVQDSLTGVVGARELSEVVLRYEKEKALLEKGAAQQENALKEAQLALREADLGRQKSWLYVTLVGMGLALLFGAFVAYAFMQTSRANRRLEKALADLSTAQDQLVRSEKLASLGQVTAGIAHEIRNPLNFVNNLSKLSVGMVEELEEELVQLEGRPLDATQADLLQSYFADIKGNAQKVLEHGERASRIVRDMLQHSAIEEGEKTEFDLNELVEEYLKVAFHSQPLTAGRGATDMKFSPDPAAGKLRGLRPEIGRALLNIMVNAFEAVQLKREGAPEGYVPQVRVATARGPQGLRVVIEDNGPGISELDMKKVFDPFFTTKPPAKGTGLGLSLAHETIVRKHKGSIVVEAVPTGGTRFTVTLPGLEA